MATENVKVLKVNTGEAQTSVKDLRNQLKELRNTLLSTEQGTEEYNNAMKQAAEIQHTLKEQMEEVNANAMDFGQIASNCTKAVGGMVAGFQAAKATLNLFGVENGEVIESLKKMQDLMAITQAFPSIDNGIKSFKRLKIAIHGATEGVGGFKKALISTGLGAIVVVLGSIIANWDEFTKSIGLSEKAMNKFKDVINGVMGVLKSSLKGLTSAITKLVTGDFKGAWEAVKNGFNVVENYNESVTEGIKKRNEEAAKKSAEKWAEYAKKRKQQLDDEAALEEARHKDNWKYTEEGKKYFEDYYDELLKLYKKDSHDYNQVLVQKLNYEKGFQKENEKIAKEADKKKRTWKDELKDVENTNKLHLESLKLRYEQGLISETQYVEEKRKLYQKDTEYYIVYLNGLLANDKLNVEERLSLTQKLIEAQSGLTENKEDSLALQISNGLSETASLLNDFSENPAWGNILNQIASISNAFDDLNKNHIAKGSKEAYSAYSAVAGAAIGTIGTLLNGLAAEQDTTNKEGFEKSKKMQIAGATMQMLAGIVTAISGAFTTKSGPWDIALAAIQASMIGALGAAQIANIAKQKYDGGSSSSVSKPNTSAISSVIAPVQYTQDVQGASIEGAIKDTKVYVTETDITDTQNKVSVTENEARF